MLGQGYGVCRYSVSLKTGSNFCPFGLRISYFSLGSHPFHSYLMPLQRRFERTILEKWKICQARYTPSPAEIEQVSNDYLLYNEDLTTTSGSTEPHIIDMSTQVKECMDAGLTTRQ